jgi:chromosome partitioning protein
MFTVSIVGPKGGTGKTTTALGLAVAACRAGQVVAIIDIDPQATASNWKDRRQDESPAVVSAQASRLKQTVETARASGADYLVIDTAGRNDDGALNAARMSDLVLVPTRANMVEVETLNTVADLLRLAGNPKAFVLLNGIHPTASKQVADTRDLVQQVFGLTCAPVHLCHRSAYAEAPTTGKAPQELDSDGKAAIELEKLYRFTCQFMPNRTPEQPLSPRPKSAARPRTLRV